MKILFVGDAIVSSGFSLCTHAACDALHAAGHEVAVLGINYFGDPHDYPYAIYPCMNPLDGGKDAFGATRLPVLVNRLEPDIVILLNDPWNVPAYLDQLTHRLPEDSTPPCVIAWLAVDGVNQSSAPRLNHPLLKHVAVWTRFAAEELVRSGYTGPAPTVIPLGVDPLTYYPRDRALSRSKLLTPDGPLSDDAFLVGAVGRNQIRKRLDLTLAYFAGWLHSYPEHSTPHAYLYLHVGPTGDRGCDIKSLARYYGLSGRVLLHEPEIGYGVTPDLMAYIYSALDLYITTSQGEGWGLPCLEAMACGVPCIVPDWSGLGDWTRGAAVQVPCTSTALTAPMNSRPYTLGGIADGPGFVNELDAMYRSELHRRTWARRGLLRAAELPWSATGDGVVATVERVYREHQAALAAAPDLQPITATGPPTTLDPDLYTPPAPGLAVPLP